MVSNTNKGVQANNFTAAPNRTDQGCEPNASNRENPCSPVTLFPNGCYRLHQFGMLRSRIIYFGRAFFDIKKFQGCIPVMLHIMAKAVAYHQQYCLAARLIVKRTIKTITLQRFTFFGE